ncbi:MAG: 2OG-Fe(II) oxygenase [Porticoccaceae bacterium]
MPSKKAMLINAEDSPEVRVYDSLLPEDMYKKLLQVSQRVGWRYGWNTPSNPEARYWHHEIGYGNKQNRACVADKVKEHPAPIFSTYQSWLLEQLPIDTKILRFYMNAYTFGTDGWPHTDTDRTGERTALLYLAPEWRPAWGGETAMFDKNGDVEQAVLPARNRLLVFPSDRLHAPRPLARAFNGLRVVLVVKIGFEDIAPSNQE